MRILVSGASGGLGKNLIAFLKNKYEIFGLIKPGHYVDQSCRDIFFIRGDIRDEKLIETATQDMDVVIHTAASFNRKDQYEVNVKGTQNLVEKFCENKGKLFIFISSMVVYGNIKMPGVNGYNEIQDLVNNNKLDVYPRSKIEAEKIVVDNCQKTNTKYIILRPSIIMGEGLKWTEGAIFLLKYFPFELSHFMTDFIHVDDFCETVNRIIGNKNCYNHIFNLGGFGYRFNDFLKIVSCSLERPLYPLPFFIRKFLSYVFSSRFLFLKRNVIINSKKIRDFTGFIPQITLEDYWSQIKIADFFPKSTHEFIECYNKCKYSYTVIGKGNYFLLNREKMKKAIIHTEQYNKILGIENFKVRVQIGITLDTLTKELDRHNLTLATLPQFLGVTVGACLSTPVHGSSYTYPNVANLVSSVTYLRDGKLFHSSREDKEWNEIIFPAHPARIVFLEATFDCIPSHYMSINITWKSDCDIVPDKIVQIFQENYSSTIQWYPVDKLVMIWKLNKVNVYNKIKIKPCPQIRRFITPPIMRFIPMMVGTFIDKSFNILGFWKSYSTFGGLFLKYRSRHGSECIFEIAVPMGDINSFLSDLRLLIIKNEGKGIQSIGLRCSGPDEIINSPSYGKRIVWVEILIFHSHWLEEIRRMFLRYKCKIHWGKYII